MEPRTTPWPAAPACCFQQPAWVRDDASDRRPPPAWALVLMEPAQARAYAPHVPLAYRTTHESSRALTRPSDSLSIQAHVHCAIAHSHAKFDALGANRECSIVLDAYLRTTKRCLPPPDGRPAGHAYVRQQYYLFYCDMTAVAAAMRERPSEFSDVERDGIGLLVPYMRNLLCVYDDPACAHLYFRYDEDHPSATASVEGGTVATDAFGSGGSRRAGMLSSTMR